MVKVALGFPRAGKCSICSLKGNVSSSYDALFIEGGSFNHKNASLEYVINDIFSVVGYMPICHHCINILINNMLTYSEVIQCIDLYNEYLGVKDKLIGLVDDETKSHIEGYPVEFVNIKREIYTMKMIKKEIDAFKEHFNSIVEISFIESAIKILEIEIDSGLSKQNAYKFARVSYPKFTQASEMLGFGKKLGNKIIYSIEEIQAIKKLANNW